MYDISIRFCIFKKKCVRTNGLAPVCEQVLQREECPQHLHLIGSVLQPEVRIWSDQYFFSLVFNIFTYSFLKSLFSFIISKSRGLSLNIKETSLYNFISKWSRQKIIVEKAFLFRNSEATRDFKNSFRRMVREEARCRILRKELAERKQRREIWKLLDYFLLSSHLITLFIFLCFCFLNSIVNTLPFLTAEMASCGMTSSTSCALLTSS